MSVVTMPVREMKSTAKFAERVMQEREILVTRNGVELMTCVSPEQRRAELDEIAKAKLLSRILLAEDEYRNGNFEDYDEFAVQIKAEYGL